MKYQWVCPKCGSARLAVAVVAWAELVQDGKGEFETDLGGERPDADQEWDNSSLMQCLGCHHVEEARSFENEEVA